MMTNYSIESRRLLIVDDNPSIHDDFRKILQHSPITPSNR